MLPVLSMMTTTSSSEGTRHSAGGVGVDVESTTKFVVDMAALRSGDDDSQATTATSAMTARGTIPQVRRSVFLFILDSCSLDFQLRMIAVRPRLSGRQPGLIALSPLLCALLEQLFVSGSTGSFDLSCYSARR